MVAPFKTEKPTYDLICVSVSSERNRPRASHKITNTWPLIDDRLGSVAGILNNYDPLSTGVPWGRTNFDQLENWGNDHVNIIPSSGQRLRDRPFLRPRVENTSGFRAPTVSGRGLLRPRVENLSGSRAQMASGRDLLRPRDENLRGSRAQMASGRGLLRPREENMSGSRAEVATDRGLLRPSEENMSGSRAEVVTDRGLLRPSEENMSGSRAEVATDRGFLRPSEENMSGSRAEVATDRGLLRPSEENTNGSRSQMVPNRDPLRPREEYMNDSRVQTVSGRGRRATTPRTFSPYELALQSRRTISPIAYLMLTDPWYSHLLESSPHVRSFGLPRGSYEYDLSELASMMRSRQSPMRPYFLNYD